MSSLKKYVGLSLLILFIFAMAVSNVNADSVDPVISFTDSTPANGVTLNQNYAYINTTVSDPSGTTAFIDWNRSLVGWWRFNNETGESWQIFRDWSSWGNNGTCSNRGNCPTSTPGMFGKALSFDGVNDLVDVGNSPSLNINDEITVEAWIYPISEFKEYAAHPISKWNPSTTSNANVVLNYFGTASGMTRTVQFNANRGGTWGSISAGYIVELNRWYHLAVSYNSTNGGQLYVNGVAIGVLTGSGKLATNTVPLRIGGSIGGGNSDYFEGMIDEVRIHNRSLNPDEIKASYDSRSYGLYRNFTNLTERVYSYRAFAQNMSGKVNQTETRTFTVHTTPPGSITNLQNITYAQTYINWTWTDPANVDFNHTMIYLNGTFQTNISRGNEFYNATDLTPDTEYTIGTHTVDRNGNINQTWVNRTDRTAPDTTPPASITDLTISDFSQTYINWTWTDPANVDFNHTMIYLNGTFQTNISKGNEFYNAIDLTPDTEYTIGTHTVDKSGNINQTWVNHTMSTSPDPILCSNSCGFIVNYIVATDTSFSV